VKKDSVNPAANIISRFRGGEELKIRKPILRKMLLKQITQFYAELLEKFEQSGRDDQINLSNYVYEFFQTRHMNLTVAENKFKQIIASVHKHSEITRVNNFGRFLGLWKPLDSDMLALYLDCISFVYNN
jgi:hypothetical protein